MANFGDEVESPVDMHPMEALKTWAIEHKNIEDDIQIVPGMHFSGRVRERKAIDGQLCIYIR